MKLRNAHLAVVERQKLVDYLLNASHPDNGGKAKFFASLGFYAGDAEPLVAALQGVASEGDMVASAHSVHGEKHVVEGGWWRTLELAAGPCAQCGLLMPAARRRGWSRPTRARSESST